MHDVIIVHYHEIALKGGNRPYFEKALVQNIQRALDALGAGKVKRAYGRVVVEMDGAQEGALIEALKRVFGIEYFSPAKRCAQEIGEMEKAALEEVEGREFTTFRVSTSRSNKEFPLTSLEVNRQVGAAVVEAQGKKVKLKDPDLTVHIEIVDRDAYVYSEKIKGPGGLPTGVSGRAIALLSGGIDSPVAAYQMMKRGLKLTFVHFHSAPITSDDSVEKAKDLVRILSAYQGPSDLYSVPLGDIQKEIWTRTPAELRMVLYRRMMLRIAEKIARKVRAKALITGESLGQVASQTLENLTVIEEVANLPLFRPLIGEDKEEIIQKARTIGTYDISIMPHEDCCTLFVPKHPETRADPDFVDKVEGHLDIPALIKMGMYSLEKERL